MAASEKSFFSTYRNLILLLACSFAVRILIFIRFAPWDDQVLQKQILIFDSLGYHNLALCIQHHLSFCGDAFRTPGYPFFVAIIYSLVGAVPYAVIFAQIFLNLLSVLIVYKIGKQLFSKRVGFIAAVLFSLDLHHTIFIYYILTETIYTTIFLCALWAYISGLQRNKKQFYIVAGILYGISALIRPISEFYIFCAAVFTVLWYWKQWKHAIVLSTCMLGSYFVCVAPWCMRNYTTYGTFALSNIKGYNLLFWNASYYESKRQHKPIEEINAEFIEQLKTMGWRPDSNPFDKEKYDGELANKILKEHFPDYLKTHLIGTVKIHLSVGTQSLTDVLHIPAKKWTEEEKYTNGVVALVKKFFATKTIYEILLGTFVAAYLLIVYGFAAAGILRMIKEKKTLLMLFLLGSAGYFALISGIISYARYRLPSMPFYILLASLGIAWLMESRKRKSEYSMK
jgi:4-amino-4-deoxy-L-arabinose transferase-like glycosyltransferase